MAMAIIDFIELYLFKYLLFLQRYAFWNIIWNLDTLHFTYCSLQLYSIIYVLLLLYQHRQNLIPQTKSESIDKRVIVRQKQVEQMSQTQHKTLQYEISLNSFRQQSAHKAMLLQKMQFQLVSKLRQKPTKAGELSCQLVKHCRKNIEEIQRIFSDVKSYFIELGIQFVLELVLAMFKILIMCFKVLSQRFVTVLKSKKEQQLNQPRIQVQSFPQKTQKLLQAFKNKDITQMQYFDTLLKTIQQDQQRLLEKKKIAEQNIIFERDSVQSINPSDAVGQLQTLKKHLDRIIVYSEKLGDEGNVFRSEQNYKYMESLRRPQQIQQEFCQKLSQTTKQTFVQKMQQIALKFQQKFRQSLKLQVIKQINLQKPKLIHRQCQTCQLDPRYRTENTKDKSVLIMENEQLRKANVTLRKELVDLGKEVQLLQNHSKELEKKNALASQMLNRKMLELQKARADFEYNLNKKDLTIEALTKKIIDIKSQRTQLQTQSHLQTPSETAPEPPPLDQFNMEDSLLDDSSGQKIKVSGRERAHHTSFYYQRQFKLQRQQNCHLRKSLSIVLDALKEQKLILQYPISDLNNDLRLECISIQLLKKVKQIKLKETSRQQQPKRSQKKKKTTIPPNQNSSQVQKLSTTSIGTQTVDLRQKQAGKTNYQNSKSIPYNTKNRENNQAKNDDKLDVLKKDLINRINSGTKPATNRSRPFLHEIQGLKNANNVSLEDTKHFNQTDNSFRQTKGRPVFNRKDISFEQFKINPQQNKSHYAQKKIMHKVKKSHDNLKLLNQGMNVKYQRSTRRLHNRSEQLGQIVSQMYQNSLQQFSSPNKEHNTLNAPKSLRSPSKNSFNLKQRQSLLSNLHFNNKGGQQNNIGFQVNRIIQEIDINKQNYGKVKSFFDMFINQLRAIKGDDFVHYIFGSLNSREEGLSLRNKQVINMTNRNLLNKNTNEPLSS